MATTTTAITAEQLLEMDSDQRCELVKGELVMMTPAGYQHGEIALEIGARIRDYARQHHLGRALSAEPGFVLSRDPDTVRAPDVAFVSGERQPKSPAGFYPGPPDLAVEVVSPSDRVGAVQEKVQAWLDAGTRLVWTVWPSTRSVKVHRPGAEPVILSENDTLTGGDVLGGFECPVAEIFRT
jgi:Uma2 family endonuclease